MGISNQEVSLAILSASGLPAPFSMRDNVDAETPVSSARSRRLRPFSSRRRRTAVPNSAVLTRFFFTMPQSLPPKGFSCKTLFYPRNNSLRRRKRKRRTGARLWLTVIMAILRLSQASPRSRHCQIACARHYFDRLRNLWIFPGDYACGDHRSVGGGHQILPQLHLDK